MRKARVASKENSTQNALQDLLGMEETRIESEERIRRERRAQKARALQREKELKLAAEKDRLEKEEQMRIAKELAAAEVKRTAALEEKRMLHQLELEAKQKADALTAEHEMRLASIQKSGSKGAWVAYLSVGVVFICVLGITLVYKNMSNLHETKVLTLQSQFEMQMRRLEHERTKLTTLLASEKNSNMGLKSELNEVQTRLSTMTREMNNPRRPACQVRPKPSPRRPSVSKPKPSKPLGNDPLKGIVL